MRRAGVSPKGVRRDAVVLGQEKARTTAQRLPYSKKTARPGKNRGDVRGYYPSDRYGRVIAARGRNGGSRSGQVLDNG